MAHTVKRRDGQRHRLVTLLTLASASALVPLAQASDEHVSLDVMRYQESDDRMGVSYGALDLLKDFGTDYTLNLGFTYDTLSGGSPSWDSVSGASSLTTSDSSSGASPCNDQTGSYYDTCRNTRDGELLGDGQTSTDGFVYHKVQMDDTRKAIYGALTTRTESRSEITTGAAFSTESDFHSMEGSVDYLFYLDELKNRAINLGASYQSNEAYFYRDDTWRDSHVLNSQIGWTEVYSPTLLSQLRLFYLKESGELSNPYSLVIRKVNVMLDSSDGAYFKYYLAPDDRPDERNLGGVNLDLVKQLYPLTLHGTYRYYHDDWGIDAHTLDSALFYELESGWRLTGGLRFYDQSEALFYKGHDQEDFYFDEQGYATADERLSAFSSVTYKLGAETPFYGDWKWRVNLATQHQTTGLDMSWLTLGVTYAL